LGKVVVTISGMAINGSGPRSRTGPGLDLA
jgi:hypothetical protein